MEEISLLGDLFIAGSRSRINWNISSLYVIRFSHNSLIYSKYLCLAGVILSSDPTPIESRQFAEEKKVAVASLGTGKSSNTTSTTMSTTTTTSSTPLPDLLPNIPVIVTTEDAVIYGSFKVKIFNFPFFLSFDFIYRSTKYN